MTRHYYGFRYQDGRHTAWASSPGAIAGDLHRFSSPAVWTAGFGIGSMLEIVGEYETEAEALAAGIAACRVRVAATVAEIRAARGGTLAWGAAVEPRDEPIVVRPRVGESAWSAYSAAEVT